MTCRLYPAEGKVALYAGYTTRMLHLIVWVVIGLLALSFFGISLRALVDNPTNQDNMEFLTSTLAMGWDYIQAWFAQVWASLTGWSK